MAKEHSQYVICFSGIYSRFLWAIVEVKFYELSSSNKNAYFLFVRFRAV